MKTITVAEAKNRLPEIIDQVNGGEVIILKNGDRQVTLRPGAFLDPELDSPELEAELLKGVQGPFTRYIPGELKERTARLIAKRASK